ncbi:hypothetical protein B1813_01465 [Saccharomonospora piscinae]|uniref:DUF6351 domain-containing protein n=1 Tax=Saccharomonospora piscinae TaxID=687388 RepID=A0A1V9ACD0_SACPI|nr:DUF6351 family protein [Saccharomonospora piscinae]OQO94785.1 hypothetical protein B1813_01465 [Saccharomonospora piscinae]
MRRGSGRRLLAALVVSLLSTLVVALAPGHSAAGERELRVRVLSSRPDTVTSGDALVRVDVPRGFPLPAVSVRVNGRDVTGSFTVDRRDRTLTGLVGGLRAGRNEIVAAVPGRGRPRAELVVTNHPAEGPVFSGEHQQPFRCETTDFRLPVLGATLGRPLDDDCSIATRVDYFYRTTGAAFAPWPEGTTAYPGDLATTTTSRGARVPYVVRMETGTANRGIYQFTVLHDPLAEPAPSHAAPPSAWNGRVLYTLGGGCVNGWYRQGNTTGGVTDDAMLREGYGVLSSSLNVYGANCADVTAAETAMMVKERFVERYGPIEHTIGFGCSGGSYQAHQIVDNYPGIFDGIIVGCSFPEVGFGTVNFITDAWLLHEYFGDSEVEWTREQQRAVTGFLRYETAPNVAAGARRIDPTAFCDMVPEDERYHPDTNPAGVRCGVYDHAVNVYGRDPDTGFARRPLDNVGIQYGLGALNDGTITVEQFLDLNAGVGGFDDDANIVARRTQGDREAIRIAYRTGRLTNGGGGLGEVPIIDYRAYQDDSPNGDIHVRYHTFSMRERLRAANTSAANHVSLLEDDRYGNFSTRSPLLRSAIDHMDRWLTNLDFTGDAPFGVADIAAAKPDGLREGCYSRDENPVFVAQPLDRDPASECERWYPSASFPREVAGEGVAADIVKCRLKPVDAADYDVPLSERQWQRLRATFPDGVCDYTRPGIEQQGLLGTWLRYPVAGIAQLPGGAAQSTAR